MNENQQLTDFMSILKKDYSNDWAYYIAREDSVVGNFTTTMHTLALFCGAFIAGALILLGSDMPADKTLVVVGIIILIAEIVFIFGFLLHKAGKDTQTLNEFKQHRLAPTTHLLLLYEDLIKNKITREHFDNEVAKSAQEIKNAMLTNNLQFITKPITRNYWDSVYLILIGLGSFLIICGLLSPYIHT